MHRILTFFWKNSISKNITQNIWSLCYSKSKINANCNIQSIMNLFMTLKIYKTYSDIYLPKIKGITFFIIQIPVI